MFLAISTELSPYISVCIVTNVSSYTTYYNIMYTFIYSIQVAYMQHYVPLNTSWYLGIIVCTQHCIPRRENSNNYIDRLIIVTSSINQPSSFVYINFSKTKTIHKHETSRCYYYYPRDNVVTNEFKRIKTTYSFAKSEKQTIIVTLKLVYGFIVVD